MTRPVVRAAALRALLLAAAAVGLAGCQSFELKPPEDFVELEEPDWSDFALRATNADGVVLAVRQVDNDRRGSLAFWRQAIENRVRAVNGYALLKQEEVTAASGQKGFRMDFGRDEGSQTFAYHLSVFVTDAHVFVVESGGKKADFDKVASELERSIADVRVH